MQRDEVIPLPSGTEITVEAALGDVSRAISYLANQWDRSLAGGVGDEEANALVADLDKVSELLRVLIQAQPTSEVTAILRRCQFAQHGDSNDEEIDALGEALNFALDKLGLDWPDWPEEGVRYTDRSHPEESTFTIINLDDEDELVAELDNGQWYELDGPEGLIAKLDAGIVRRVEQASS